MKNNIRVERAVLRISQQQLAEAVGVSRQTIYAIENGKFIPSTGYVRQKFPDVVGDMQLVCVHCSGGDGRG